MPGRSTPEYGLVSEPSHGIGAAGIFWASNAMSLSPASKEDFEGSRLGNPIKILCSRPKKVLLTKYINVDITMHIVDVLSTFLSLSFLIDEGFHYLVQFGLTKAFKTSFIYKGQHCLVHAC